MMRVSDPPTMNVRPVTLTHNVCIPFSSDQECVHKLPEVTLNQQTYRK